MKGAIGSAFILNMVITFILIFYSLLIASMALTKTYKVKNYLVDFVVTFDDSINKNDIRTLEKVKSIWMYGAIAEDFINPTLQKFGYILANDAHCPATSQNTYPKNTNYQLIRNTKAGSYDYCIYVNYDIVDSDLILARYNYMVLVYMKFDFPVIGNFVKVPVTGETKTITVFK